MSVSLYYQLNFHKFAPHALKGQKLLAQGVWGLHAKLEGIIAIKKVLTSPFLRINVSKNHLIQQRQDQENLSTLLHRNDDLL